MTKSEVIKEFFKKSVLPVAVAALLYCIFKSVCTKDGVTDYVWLFILCGLPFGIPRMFAWIVPGGSLGTALPLFLLNFIIGGVIGSATSKKNTSSKTTTKKKYASGGVNDYTGDAALHGTPSHVETVFNAEDGKKLYDLVHNTKDLADTIAEDMVPYIPSLFENIGEIGFNPRNMMMPTIPKVEPQTVENDESTTFSNCKFEIKTDANNFEALVNDMEVKIKNR